VTRGGDNCCLLGQTWSELTQARRYSERRSSPFQDSVISPSRTYPRLHTLAVLPRMRGSGDPKRQDKRPRGRHRTETTLLCDNRGGTKYITERPQQYLLPEPRLQCVMHGQPLGGIAQCAFGRICRWRCWRWVCFRFHVGQYRQPKMTTYTANLPCHVASHFSTCRLSQCDQHTAVRSIDVLTPAGDEDPRLGRCPGCIASAVLRPDAAVHHWH
jgi:hypothetical protein